MFCYLVAFALIQGVASECTNKFIVTEHWNQKYQVDTGRYLHTQLVKNGARFLHHPFEKDWSVDTELMEFSYNNIVKHYYSGVKIYQICGGDYKKIGPIHKVMNYYPIGYSLSVSNMDKFNEVLYDRGFNVETKTYTSRENIDYDNSIASYIVKKIYVIVFILLIVYLIFSN